MTPDLVSVLAFLSEPDNERNHSDKHHCSVSEVEEPSADNEPWMWVTLISCFLLFCHGGRWVVLMMLFISQKRCTYNHDHSCEKLTHLFRKEKLKKGRKKMIENYSGFFPTTTKKNPQNSTSAQYQCVMKLSKIL